MSGPKPIWAPTRDELTALLKAHHRATLRGGLAGVITGAMVLFGGVSLIGSSNEKKLEEIPPTCERADR